MKRSIGVAAIKISIKPMRLLSTHYFQKTVGQLLLNSVCYRSIVKLRCEDEEGHQEIVHISESRQN